MERRDYIQREISKLSVLFKKLLGLLDQDPIEENIKDEIGHEIANNFHTDLFSLDNDKLMDFCKERNFTHENWEQLLFFFNSYNNKFPNEIANYNEKLSSIYTHIQKNNITISFEILSIVSHIKK